MTKGLYFGLARWTTKQVSGYSEPKSNTLLFTVTLLEVREHCANINECQGINNVCVCVCVKPFFIATSISASYQ